MDINYFKQWSPDVAYILGLWFAVGGRSAGRTFSLFLRSKDKYILKLAAQKLQVELKSSEDGYLVYLSFTNEEVYNDIILLCGGKDNSSLFLPAIPTEYISDFIRGYFDGRGKACKVQGNRLNVIFINENENFLKDLRAKLQQYIGVKGGSYNSSDSSLRFGTRDSRLIGEYMYKNEPELFLLRKKQKFIFKEDTQK